MKGLVLKSTGSWYQVLFDGKIIQCRTRGNLRLENTNTTNPVAVGDYVDFEFEQNSKDQGIIQEIVFRKNVVLRKAAKKTSESQIIASNVDHSLLIVTIKNPKTSLGFIDRFTVSTESFRIPTTLLFNKVDLLNETDKSQLKYYKEIYTKIGFKCFEISALIGTGIDDIKNILEDKIVLIAGHSGVGKSTLINRLVP